MTIPTPVNGQITDSVTQSAVATIAAAPAMAMGSLQQTATHSLGILYQNAVQAQQQAAICAQAATNQGVVQLYSAPSMSAAAATSKISSSDVADNLLTLLAIIKALKT